MFGLSLKVLGASVAIASAGIGWGAIKDSQAQRALRDRDAAVAAQHVLQAHLQNCAIRILDIQEDAASDLEIDQIPDALLPDNVPNHWLRNDPTGSPAPD